MIDDRKSRLEHAKCEKAKSQGRQMLCHRLHTYTPILSVVK
jgi:hypothetical protein